MTYFIPSSGGKPTRVPKYSAFQKSRINRAGARERRAVVGRRVGEAAERWNVNYRRPPVTASVTKERRTVLRLSKMR